MTFFDGLQLQPFLLLFFTQVATIIAIVVSYRRHRHLFSFQQRETARLDRLVAQLGHFYGPVYILLCRANSAYGVFLDSMTSNDTDAALRILREVLIPINERLSEIILNRADLLRSDDKIERYELMLLHADMLKLKFDEEQGISTLPHVAFPEEIIGHVKELYERALQDKVKALESR